MTFTSDTLLDCSGHITDSSYRPHTTASTKSLTTTRRDVVAAASANDRRD